MSTALTARISTEEIATINAAAADCRTALQQAAGKELAGCLIAAEAMERLRSCLTTTVMQSVAALQGSTMGFKTDKDGKGGYKAEELRDFTLEAAVRGFRLIGNECNVISGRFYGCKAGFERLVKNFPGLANFVDAYDIMEVVNGNAKVQAIATFTLDGVPQRLARQKENSESGVFDNRISVRVNAGMGPDAIEGKAKRKFWAWIYDRLMSVDSDTPEGEVGDADGDAPRKEMIPMFAGGAVKEEKQAADDGCPLIVEEYRGKFSVVAERSEIGKVMAMAGRDSRLTPKGRTAVAALASEAQKIWPKRLAGDSDESEPPFNPPTQEEVKEAGQAERNGAGTKSQTQPTRSQNASNPDADLERDSAVNQYLEQIALAVERKDRNELGRIKAHYVANGVVNYHVASMRTLNGAITEAMKKIGGGR
jgi:hypothetical protein